MKPINISTDWLARLRADRVSWVHVDGASGAQRGDQVTLGILMANGALTERVTAEITDVSPITIVNDDHREVVVATIVSVKLLG
jgi:hypothetical protein